MWEPWLSPDAHFSHCTVQCTQPERWRRCGDSLQVFPGGCVCVRRTLAPALAADTGQGQIGGHLVKFEKSQKRCSLDHAHRSDTHVRPVRGAGSVALRHRHCSLFGWSLQSLGIRSLDTDGRTGPDNVDVCGLILRRSLALPATRPASSGLWLDAVSGICSRQPGDVCGGWVVTVPGEGLSEWRLVLAQWVWATCSSTVHPTFSWTPRPCFRQVGLVCAAHFFSSG